jgi:hypothetical protein
MSSADEPRRAPIPVLERLSPIDFQQTYLAQERPVILRNAIRDWEPLRTWTPEYLRGALGESRVTVARSPDGDYYDPDTKVLRLPDVKLPFSEFIDHVFSPSGSTDKYYLKQTSLSEFEPLARQVLNPDHIQTPDVTRNLWIGSAGNVTGAHYDMEENLLAQVRGRKRVILAPSSQMDELYPCSPFSIKPNFSRVNLARPDLSRFARYRQATPLEGTLEPGDVLYIPIYWWHHVTSLDAGISVNFWWHADPRRILRYNRLRFILKVAREGYVPLFTKELLKAAVSSVTRRAGRAPQGNRH